MTTLFGFNANAWLIIGFLGQFLFFMRFIVQWIVSERKGESTIPVAFWYFSILGGAITFIYALHIKDPVFFAGQGAALFVYTRNLHLIKKKNSKSIGSDFPRRSDYPNSFEILDDPYKNIDLYMRLCVSSASAYFETDPITNYLFKRRFHLVRDYIRQSETGRFKNAVDIGCGIGFFLPVLASCAHQVTALDYSDGVLDYARSMAEKRQMKNVNFVRGTIRSLPFPDQSFDLVVCMSVLEHFHDPEQPLRELKRILAPGGLLVVGYPTETPLFHFLHNTASRLAPKRKKIQKIFDKENPGEEFAAPHVANAQMIEKAMHSVGFQTADSRSIRLLPPFFKLYNINFLHV